MKYQTRQIKKMLNIKNKITIKKINNKDISEMTPSAIKEDLTNVAEPTE